MSVYEKMIIEFTGCPEADAAEVEETMRVEHPTLNDLSRSSFRRCAKEAWEAVQWMRTPEGKAFMESV